MHVDRPICIYIFKFFSFPEDFFTMKETVKENVPVDTDSTIRNMKLLLMFSCNWRTIREKNCFSAAPF